MKRRQNNRLEMPNGFDQIRKSILVDVLIECCIMFESQKRFEYVMIEKKKKKTNEKKEKKGTVEIENKDMLSSVMNRPKIFSFSIVFFFLLLLLLLLTR